MAKSSRKGKNASGGGGAPELDKELIRKANEAGTVVDYGDSTNRQYKNNLDEINKMDLTADERKKAVTDLYNLTTEQLKAEAKARSPYASGMGPARFNQKEVRQSADNAADARKKVNNHMENLRKGQKERAEKKANERLYNAMNNAIKNGDLSFTVDGKTYTRKTKRSKSFTTRD